MQPWWAEESFKNIKKIFQTPNFWTIYIDILGAHMPVFLWSGLWSNHPKPKLIWGVKVICTVWNHQYKKSGKKPRSPHALSQVPKGKSLPNIPVLFSQICHLWLTTPPHSVWSCHRASGCHSEASFNLPSVTSQDQDITHHSLCHLRQDRGSARCQIHAQVPHTIRIPSMAFKGRASKSENSRKWGNTLEMLDAVNFNAWIVLVHTLNTHTQLHSSSTAVLTFYATLNTCW